MQTNYRFQTLNFTNLLYEGSVLFLYVLGLVVTVAFGAYGLDKLSTTFW